MIGSNSVDWYTNTEADAGRFEQMRGGGYDGYREDAPDARELAEMAEDDRRSRQRQAEADAAARARGEYVPSSAMRLTAGCLSLALGQQRVFDLDVHCAREGILSVTPKRGATITREQAVAAVEEAYARGLSEVEVREHNGVVWVRIIRTPFADPFVQDGVAQDDPPF